MLRAIQSASIAPAKVFIENAQSRSPGSIMPVLVVECSPRGEPARVTADETPPIVPPSIIRIHVTTVKAIVTTCPLALRAPDQDPCAEDQEPADHDLEGGGEEGRIHVAIAHPGDHAELDGD